MIAIHQSANDLFVKYYQNKLGPRRFPAHPQMLQHLIGEYWVLSKDQCLLDCIRAGYSACVSWPEINRIHDQMTAEYHDYCREHGMLPE